MSEALKHIAFIMDGNGRWAQRRGWKRQKGHREGLETVRRVLRYAKEKGIGIVSLYVFSTENWSRPQEEVEELFDLARRFLSVTDFKKEKIRVLVSGRQENLPKDLTKKICTVTEKTKDFRDFTVQLCIDYGGRDEIVSAVNRALKSGVSQVTEETFRNFLYQKDLPDPDLIVRTGGELRLSNFLMYQSAYSELYFTDVLWPDFSEKDFDEVLEAYRSRERKFGKV